MCVSVMGYILGGMYSQTVFFFAINRTLLYRDNFPLMIMQTETLKCNALMLMKTFTVAAHSRVLHTVNSMCWGGRCRAHAFVLFIYCLISEKSDIQYNVYNAITWTHSTKNYVLQSMLARVHCTIRINTSPRMHIVNT